LRRLSQRR